MLPPSLDLAEHIEKEKKEKNAMRVRGRAVSHSHKQKRKRKSPYGVIRAVKVKRGKNRRG